MSTDLEPSSIPSHERRRQIRVTDSQLGDLVDKVSANRQLYDMLNTRLSSLESRAQGGDDRLFRLEASLEANTKLTASVAADTRETRELMEMGKTLFKFAAGFGRFVRWAASIAAAVAGLWALLKDTKNPWH